MKNRKDRKFTFFYEIVKSEGILKLEILIFNFFRKSLNLSLLMAFQVELIVEAFELPIRLKLHMLEQTFDLRKLLTNDPKLKHLFRIKTDEIFQPTEIFGIY